MWTNSSKLPLRDAQGHIVGTFGITHDVTESKELEIALEKSSTELIHTSRLAGMAEVATGVLHNVGNVLNSLNVSATVITAGLRSSKVESLGKVAALLKEHSADLGEYLSHDPKGKMLPEFIEKLAEHFTAERTRLHAEIESLQKNIDHIKDIVAMQQAYAHLAGGVESLDAATLMEDALRMNASALGRHSVHTVRKFQPVPAVRAERAKVLQILVNLIRNAKHALDEGMPPEKTMTVRVELGTPGLVHLVVADNGVGILAENMPRVFERGFTTRKTGHGFGLSSAIAAAREMRGSLTVRSGGYLEGAEFTLALPVADQPVAEKT
jgi:signal transduction histidine kinase